jgi:predicted TPR repeat methyltransferase
MLPFSSGDLRADRRHDYARELLKQGDSRAAADLFRQALDLASEWAPAWFGLGQSLEAMGDWPAAITAYRRALSLAPDDALGAKPRLARLGAGHPGTAMSRVYVKTLFDQYADRFDQHLKGTLQYRGPEIILEALLALHPDGMRFGIALDLGCGTGLMAATIRPHVEAIDGVDLSPAMIEKARRLGFYRNLSEGELTEALAAAANAGAHYDLLLAADVLVYCGDLASVLTAAAKAMAARGSFAFTVEALDGDGWALSDDLRYQHSLPHIEAAAAAAGLDVLQASTCVTRENCDLPVPGYVVVLRKPDA